MLMERLKIIRGEIYERAEVNGSGEEKLACGCGGKLIIRDDNSSAPLVWMCS